MTDLSGGSSHRLWQPASLSRSDAALPSPLAVGFHVVHLGTIL
jgi:hypothetical protein